MNLSDEIRDTIRGALLEEAEDWGLSGEWRMDIDEALAWLDAQPETPEPDWAKAPPWAQWWAIERCCTVASYYPRKPFHNLGQWLDDGGKFTYTIDVPLGIDWRTTLRKRPEVTE